MLWTGTAQHLWFLPFIFIATVVLFLLLRAVGPSRPAQWACAVAALGAGVALLVFPDPFAGAHEDYLWMQAWTTTPALLWGVALALGTQGRGLAWLQRGRWAAAALALGVIGLGCLGIGLGAAEYNLAGVLVLAACLGPWDGPIVHTLGRLGRLAFGIYLVHLLFLLGTRVLIQKGLHVSGLGMSVGAFLLAVACSIPAAWALTQSRWTRWLAPA
jgi:peptidoglycan/LPS O-acetylase OafA/YrhL